MFSPWSTQGVRVGGPAPKWSPRHYTSNSTEKPMVADLVILGIGLKKQFKSLLKSSMHKDFHCGIVCGNAKSKVIWKWLSELSYINLIRVNTVIRTSVHTHSIANIPTLNDTKLNTHLSWQHMFVDKTFQKS